MNWRRDEAPAIEDIAARFELAGQPLAAERYGSGHINDTWRLSTDSGDCYILQRVNRHVFREPAALMENIERVTAHLAAAGLGERERLTLVPTRDGRSHLVDDDGEYWRVYPFVGGTRILDRPEHPAQASAAASAFFLLIAIFNGQLYPIITLIGIVLCPTP